MPHETTHKPTAAIRRWPPAKALVLALAAGPVGVLIGVFLLLILLLGYQQLVENPTGQMLGEVLAVVVGCFICPLFGGMLAEQASTTSYHRPGLRMVGLVGASLLVLADLLVTALQLQSVGGWALAIFGLLVVAGSVGYTRRL